MYLAVENLCRRYGGRTVLEEISFSVEKGEIVSIIGPSGVGKTTLLKIIAGLETPSSGALRFQAAPSRQSPVILVFQDYLLFPNLTVFENVAFGLRVRKEPKAGMEEKVRRILSYFHLEDKSEHYPNQLSGGQKQRVAIARAMVLNPSVLLLDEPFANLDRNLKMETAEFIRRTQKEFDVTTISVTHDLEEAFVMSDRIGVMLDGRLVQYDTASEVYFRPASLEAACFLGPVNSFDTSLLGYLKMEGEFRPRNGVVHVRPEAVIVEKSGEGRGVVRHASFAGHFMKYVVAVNGSEIVVYSRDAGLVPGDRVSLHIEQQLFPEKERS